MKFEINRLLVLLLLLTLVVTPQIISGQDGSGGSEEGETVTSCGFGFSLLQGECVPDLFINAATMILIITLGFLGIAYMLSMLLSNVHMLNWTKSEIYQLIGTAFILGLYLASVGILDGVIGPAFYNTSLAYPGELRGGGDVTDFRTVNMKVTQYIRGVMNEASEILGGLFWLSNITGFIASLGFSITIKTVNIYLSPFTVFSSIQGLVSMLMGIVSIIVVQLGVQYSILSLYGGLFGVVLPIGIALRAFPLTRSAGSAMIAIAVALTIVLPIGYLIAEDISTHYYNKYCGGRGVSTSKFISEMGAFTRGVSGGGGVSNVQGSLTRGFSPGGFFACSAFTIFVEGTILPFFAYLISLNVAKNLAGVLGTRVDFSTLVRII